MKLSKLLPGLILLGSSVAFGQFGGPGPGGHRGGFARGHSKVITGAPYSALVSNSVVEQLPGGNTIQRMSTGQVARDSEGRTYEQITTTGGERLGQSGTRTMTFISDPVAGYSYVLDSTKMVAIRHAIRTPASGTEPSASSRSARTSSPNVVEGELPTDSSSGVEATGKSITRTIPAGAIGNAAPIVSVSQTWYSPALQIVVKAIRNDPRSGQSTYALTGIVAKEPEASLFQVPSGYTVKDVQGRGGRAASTATP